MLLALCLYVEAINRCSVMQCVAVCCSVLQCVAVCCMVSQNVAKRQMRVMQCVAACCSMYEEALQIFSIPWLLCDNFLS